MAATQRKKTDKNPLAGTTTTTTAAAGSDEELTAQLNRAQEAVERNHAATQTLHVQWRTQLLRMAYLVMIVTLHMAQAPSSTCIKDIKQFNRENPELSVPGARVISIILYDSVVEILSIACAVFLVWCLRLPNDGSDFSSLAYRLSCITLPMIISLHFHKKSGAGVTTTTVAAPHGNSCVLDMLQQGDNDTTTTFQSTEAAVTRHFPVILVFHTVVSISLWFMQYQNQQHAKNMEMVKKLKRDLTEAKGARVDKKKR